MKQIPKLNKDTHCVALLGQHAEAWMERCPGWEGLQEPSSPRHSSPPLRSSTALWKEPFRNERIRNSWAGVRTMPCSITLQRQLWGAEGEQEFRAESEPTDARIKLWMSRGHLGASVQSENRGEKAAPGTCHLSHSWERAEEEPPNPARTMRRNFELNLAGFQSFVLEVVI